jgi:hypothetical protein
MYIMYKDAVQTSPGRVCESVSAVFFFVVMRIVRIM